MIKEAEQFVKKRLKNDTSGHDWYHIDRVRKASLYICKQERKGNPFIIEMAALLHDIADVKLNASKEAGLHALDYFLQTQKIAAKDKQHILAVIESVSFNGGNGISPPATIEAKIVQDGDRLDAIGAIGIARTFAYGGSKGSMLYDPSIEIRENMSEIEYRHGKSTSIHHFYEKLLKLKDLLHTNTAKKIADERHQVMEFFLAEFYKEWNGTYEKYFN
ncbi:HD domain-containing protein [Niallia nealsonii]|uniref:Phosphohydrolase n=1 Tax=Niallia nealsonii TaxID=115979 RepID=A0A2N0Z3G7_9BACI|nr:HD domain-containing protein [Niallia nealsonii]PKG24050.1 phosphohydrolase [Niallia nealsonii]